MTLRYDPSRGGIYDDKNDEQDPTGVAGSDTTAMPNAAPLRFNADPSGAPAAAASSMAAVAPFAAATTPVTLTGSSWKNSTETPVVTKDDAIAEGARANARDEQADIARQQGDIAKAQKLNESRGKEREAGVYGDEEAKQADTAAKLQARLAAYDAEQRKLEKEVASTPITDGWAKKSTGDKILAGLSIMLYGLGQGLTRDNGPNRAFEDIKATLAEDRQEQLRQLESKRKRAEALRGPMREQAIKEWEAERDRATATSALRLKQVAAQTDALAARTGSESVQLAAGEKSAELRATSAKEMADHNDKIRQKIHGEVGGEQKQVVPAGTGAKDTSIQDLRGKDIGAALSPVEAEKVHAARAATQSFLSTAADLKRHLLKYGRDFNEDPGVQAERQALRNVLVGKMSKELMESGVLNGSEFPRNTEIIDTGLRRGGADAAHAVDALAAQSMHGYDAIARGMGRLQPNATPVPADMMPSLSTKAEGGFGLRRSAAAPHAAPAPSAAPAGDIVTVTKGPHAGQQARRLPNGQFELLE